MRDLPRSLATPKINWSRAPANGLALALFCAERSARPRDSAGYKPGIVGTPSGGISYTRGAIHATGSDGILSMGSVVNNPLYGATEFTIMARIKWDGGGAGINRLFVSGSNAGQTVLTFSFWKTANGNLTSAIKTTGGYNSDAGTPDRLFVPVNRWCTVGLRWSSADTAIYYYLDGVMVTTSSVAAGTIVIGSEFSLLNRGTLDGAFSGDMAWLLAWRRSLPVGQMQCVDEDPYRLIVDTRFTAKKMTNPNPTDASKGVHYIKTDGSRGFSSIAEPFSMIPATGLTGDLTYVICGSVPLDGFDDGNLVFNGRTLEMRGEVPPRGDPDGASALHRPEAMEYNPVFLHVPYGPGTETTNRTLRIRDLVIERVDISASCIGNRAGQRDTFILRDCVITYACVDLYRYLNYPAIAVIFNNVFYSDRVYVASMLRNAFIYLMTDLDESTIIENNAFLADYFGTQGERAIWQEYDPGAPSTWTRQIIRNNVAVVPEGVIAYDVYDPATLESCASTDQTGSAHLRGIIAANEIATVDPLDGARFMRTKQGGLLAWGGVTPSYATLSVDGEVRDRDGKFTIGINECPNTRTRDILMKLLPESTAHIVTNGGGDA